MEATLDSAIGVTRRTCVDRRQRRTRTRLSPLSTTSPCNPGSSGESESVDDDCSTRRREPDRDAALAAVTEREETVAAAMHQLAAARKRMPMVQVEHDYRFGGPDGQRSLAELFDGRSQLVLYRFFFEEGVDHRR